MIEAITYNGAQLDVACLERPNIYLGIGFWSKGKGLTEGLPVDVFAMLLSASMARRAIDATGQQARVVILLADSMAIQEGADPEQVARIVTVYQEHLSALMRLLQERAEIVLASELVEQAPFLEIEQRVRSLPLIQEQLRQDPEHAQYLVTQTAITLFMQVQMGVGVKVGWIHGDSERELQGSTVPEALAHWDELKFDRWAAAVCPDLSMQYLYTFAGLKQPFKGSSIQVHDGCPYTGYACERSWLMGAGEQDVVPKAFFQRWIRLKDIVKQLVAENKVDSALFPESCVVRNNEKLTIRNWIAHLRGIAL
ncbi:MAG: hypothetical protein RL235_66 [Chlamydiota bacterium]|jgi:hypothetical protein